MRAEKAAAYCDEPSVEAFLTKVKLGIYCAPVSTENCRDKWSRHRLDCDIARRHNLLTTENVLIEDVASLI